jgi:hypothetical protein
MLEPAWHAPKIRKGQRSKSMLTNGTKVWNEVAEVSKSQAVSFCRTWKVVWNQARWYMPVVTAFQRLRQ